MLRISNNLQNILNTMLLKQNKVLKNGKVILKKEEESSKANTEDPIRL